MHVGLLQPHDIYINEVHYYEGFSGKNYSVITSAVSTETGNEVAVAYYN